VKFPLDYGWVCVLALDGNLNPLLYWHLDFLDALDGHFDDPFNGNLDSLGAHDLTGRPCAFCSEPSAALGPSDLDIGTGDFQLGLQGTDSQFVLDPLGLDLTDLLTDLNPRLDSRTGVELPSALTSLTKRATQAASLALEVGHRSTTNGRWLRKDEANEAIICGNIDTSTKATTKPIMAPKMKPSRPISQSPRDGKGRCSGTSRKHLRH